jgi:hypothetical protein
VLVELRPEDRALDDALPDVLLLLVLVERRRVREPGRGRQVGECMVVRKTYMEKTMTPTDQLSTALSYPEPSIWDTTSGAR